MTTVKAIVRYPKVESVILVDEQDRPLGAAEKQFAHIKSKLHRAFSIFIFNERGELLLQRRATSKYHSGDLWANTCCGHPRPGERTKKAAQRRLMEEFGFSSVLTRLGHIRYRAEVTRGLTENEYVHIFVGTYRGDISPDPAEIREYRFSSWESVINDVNHRPSDYAPWFRVYLTKNISTLNTALSSFLQ